MIKLLFAATLVTFLQVHQALKVLTFKLKVGSCHEFGFLNVNQRIVGGEEAPAHSLPHQVALWVHLKSRVAFCGGSLISENYVLTAAHCVETASMVEVVLGAHELKTNEATQIRMNSTDFLHHADWSMITMKNDIALIKLPQPVKTNDNIRPVKLPKRSDAVNLFEKEPCIVSGWGKDTDSATEVSPVLRKVEVPVYDQFLCSLQYMGVVKSSHICTNSKGGKGTCNGDSGGPLILKEDGTQVGIVSFGLALGCEIGWPAVYTRVTSHLDWIQENSDVVIQS